MLGHMLKMFLLDNRTADWRSKQIEVMVTLDQWEYSKGRNIEFIAVGLPEQFAFAVTEHINDVTDIKVRTGDCRQGSWAGIATKIGINRYQGVQSTGLSNAPSGLLALGASTAFDFNLSTAQTNNTARTAMGMRVDAALVNSYATGAQIGGMTPEKVKVPHYSNDILDTPDPRYYLTSFGTALEPNTKTIRSTAAVVREQVYERTGDINTTCFESYGPSFVGGITSLARGVEVAGTTAKDTNANLSKPFIGYGMGSVSRGSNGQATWSRWMVAGGNTVSPFRVHYLVLTVSPTGTYSWSANGGVIPVEGGQDFAGEAYAMYTDDTAATANNATNQQILINTYLSSKSRESSYELNYPTCVPVTFSPAVGARGGKNTKANKWTTKADFIEHNYTIGGN